MLYLDLENGESRIYERLQKSLNGKRFPGNLHIVLEWQRGDRDQFLRLLDERKRLKLAVIATSSTTQSCRGCRSKRRSVASNQCWDHRIKGENPKPPLVRRRPTLGHTGFEAIGVPPLLYSV